ncbi:DUF2156 domain-containing protein [Candidatus Woesearchaeota archaeon]|nr:DUF2156 domain-containing protein [Candidatus Woesearchaeota archaeon]
MELNEITMEDKVRLDKYFKTIKEPLSDTTFAMRNNNLCFFGFLKDKHVLWGPPLGGNKMSDTLSICFDAIEKLNNAIGINANPVAIYIPEFLKDEYGAIACENDYAFSYWAQDYVYNTQDLMDLKGRHFDSKRHKVNFFTKNYDYSVEEFDFEKHGDDCLELIEFWKEQKKSVVPDFFKYEFEAETKAAIKLIRFSRELGVKGIVLRVEGKVVGVSLGEPLTKDMCSNIIEKTRTTLNGASEFIFREFARCWSSHKFINAQDDFGVDSLKKIKLSYHPVKLLKSYSLERKPH